jgi:hypothetical protein
VTVSGTGVRFIGLSNNAAPVHRKFTLDSATGEAIELYRNCERYVTVSGFVADLDVSGARPARRFLRQAAGPVR